MTTKPYGTHGRLRYRDLRYGMEIFTQGEFVVVIRKYPKSD